MVPSQTVSDEIEADPIESAKHFMIPLHLFSYNAHINVARSIVRDPLYNAGERDLFAVPASP